MCTYCEPLDFSLLLPVIPRLSERDYYLAIRLLIVFCHYVFIVRIKEYLIGFDNYWSIFSDIMETLKQLSYASFKFNGIIRKWLGHLLYFGKLNLYFILKRSLLVYIAFSTVYRLLCTKIDQIFWGFGGSFASMDLFCSIYYLHHVSNDFYNM